MRYPNQLLFLFILVFASCEKEKESQPEQKVNNSVNPILCEDDGSMDVINNRNFMMGFSTWPYGPDSDDLDDTYNFIAANSDIYSEQMDDKIPWSAWINSSSLPQPFVDQVNGKLARKIPNKKLVLSVSLFNDGRTGLKEDFNGSAPSYDSLNEQKIEDAYFDHLNYLIQQFQPDYLVAVMEANDFLKNDSSQWANYKLLMQSIRTRLKQAHPNLPISESITLHNFYMPQLPNPSAYIQEIKQYINKSDFAAISFYPFFKGMHNKAGFQLAFDFLHNQVSLPIAFVETTHLAEDLVVPNLNTNITSDPCEQQDYLEQLSLNAYSRNYLFYIWWAHRDYDELWNTLPPDLKDLGQVWRDTGILDENGNERPAYQSWKRLFNL